MLTNLTGEKKVQFYQEKRWQTGNTPHCMKCAYIPKQNATTLELARDLPSKNLSSFLFSYNALQIADPCKCSMSHMNFILAWLVLLSEGNANFFTHLYHQKRCLPFVDDLKWLCSQPGDPDFSDLTLSAYKTSLQTTYVFHS